MQTKFNNRTIKQSNNKNGFTLVELIVVFGLLAILIGIAILILNPFGQLRKAYDTKRQSDIEELTKALDIYYHDNNCYPPSLASLTSGGQSAYIKKLPQDPEFSSTGQDYVYINNNSVCPQWHVLFAKLNFKRTNTGSCSLEKLTSCLPQNYTESGYNSCTPSGNISTAECSVINASTLPEDSSGPPACSKDYSCTGNPPHCSVITVPNSGQYCTSDCDGNC
ncbi:MAG: hypothetical protein A2171_01905 [Candidatus Levybacteria bacterium RBG_13_35_9]|nr:MAG: hypothetical protein A2171_01905 [Candidatus Levybacteria bacterium RBG_13_35_9]